MKEYISGDDVVATVILLRDDDSRVVVLVEGESDCSVLDGHINDASAVTLPAFGKNNVIAALDKFAEANIGGVIGVIDSDWIGVLPGTTATGAIVVSENYDLDVDVMLLPGLFSRFALAHFDREAVLRALDSAGVDELLDRVFAIAAPIGILRYVAARDRLSIPLRDFPAESVVDVRNLACDVRRLAMVAADRSGGTLVADQIESMVESELSALPSPLHRFVSGHDAAAVLAIVGRRLLGARGLSRDHVERGLRAAVGCAEFRQLNVARSLSLWGSARGVEMWHCVS